MVPLYFLLVSLCCLHYSDTQATFSTCVQNGDCSGLADGTYPSCTSCTSYVTCIGETSNVIACSAGTSYDVTTGKCSPDGECSRRRRRSTESDEDSEEESEEDSEEESDESEEDSDESDEDSDESDEESDEFEEDSDESEEDSDESEEDSDESEEDSDESEEDSDESDEDSDESDEESDESEEDSDESDEDSDESDEDSDESDEESDEFEEDSDESEEDSDESEEDSDESEEEEKKKRKRKLLRTLQQRNRKPIRRTGCVYSCKGLKDGRYNSCHVCQYYVVCSYGQLTKYSCYYGYKYDSRFDTCRPYSSTCRDRHRSSSFTGYRYSHFW